MYSLKKGLLKAGKYLAIFAAPFVLAQILAWKPELNTLTPGDIVNNLLKPLFPISGTLTIGAILTWLVNFVKIKAQE